MQQEKFNDPFDCINNKLPWDIDTPDIHLVNWFNSQPIKPVTLLEIGCGSGVNAVWLAQQGCQVTAVDFHPSAIQATAQRANFNKVQVDIKQLDVLKDTWPEKEFDFIFDRGFFHGNRISLDEKKRFINNISNSLNSCGLWLSLIGSKDSGPGMKGFDWFMSATDVVTVVEPCLQIINLSAAHIEMLYNQKASAWKLIAGKRPVDIK
jgi:SAM-dependent methyltransferase